jgi:hypothetical protein
MQVFVDAYWMCQNEKIVAFVCRNQRTYISAIRLLMIWSDY